MSMRNTRTVVGLRMIFTLSDRGVIAPVACSGKACVSVVVVEPLSSGPTQSPAHSFVPRTVPTSLQPIGFFGFT